MVRFILMVNVSLDESRKAVQVFGDWLYFDDTIDGCCSQLVLSESEFENLIHVFVDKLGYIESPNLSNPDSVNLSDLLYRDLKSCVDVNFSGHSSKLGLIECLYVWFNLRVDYWLHSPTGDVRSDNEVFEFYYEGTELFKDSILRIRSKQN